MGTQPSLPDPQRYIETKGVQPTRQDFTTPKRHNILGVPSTLSIKQVKVAQQLATGNLTQGEIGAKLGVSQATIQAWKSRNPAFKQYLEQYRKLQAQVVLDHGAALQHNRLKRLERAAQDLEQLRDARAAALEGQAPGAETGWLAKDVKSIGAGPFAQVVDVYEFDAAHYKAYCETLKQSAQEVGGAFLRPDSSTHVTVQTSVIATSDTKSVLQVLTRNEDSVDV